jgi:hypothetical protein
MLRCRYSVETTKNCIKDHKNENNYSKQIERRKNPCTIIDFGATDVEGTGKTADEGRHQHHQP